MEKIKKRNGLEVDFDSNKIKVALNKAYMATMGSIDEAKLAKMLGSVLARIKEDYYDSGRPLEVEGVQDIVEQIIIQAGDYKVGKAYIVYRYEHARKREELEKAQQNETLEKISDNVLGVTKRDGKVDTFSVTKLKRSLELISDGLKGVDIDAIIKQVQIEIFDGISSNDLAKTIVACISTMIEVDIEYSKLASRARAHRIYKDVIGADKIDFSILDQQYRQAFIDNINFGVEIGRIDKELLAYDLEDLSTYIKPERDHHFLYMGIKTIDGRNLISDPNNNRILETPQAFWMRVAMGLSLLEPDRQKASKRFYDLMSQMLYVPSTPTLLHSGQPKAQLSSCFLNTVEDDLYHIFKVYSDNAQMSKWSGGIGTDWTNVRATNAMINAVGVPSQGLVPFLKISNDVTISINRSGKRRGAAAVYLETWHMDIEDFLELRKNTGDERRRTHDINTVNWVPDLFMKRVLANEDWTLFSPDEVPELHHIYGQAFEQKYVEYELLARAGKIKLHKTISASDLWRKMLAMLFETGHPWITFKDPCNVRSPQDHAGVVHNSNLCTEITLNNSADETAVCNLGSINLPRHLRKVGDKWEIDKDLLASTISTAVRMLDNVIDISFYPVKEGENSNKAHRPIGLGIMGFQDLLYHLNINFESEACVNIADQTMEFISYHAILTSSLLAKERGAYKSFKGSKWDRGILPLDTLDLLEKERGLKIDVDRSSKLDWSSVRDSIALNGMRNSNVMAMAPTATISNLAGVLPTIEPIYKNIYVKANQAGEFVVVNSYLIDDLKKINLWNKAMLDQIKYHDGNLSKIDNIPADLKNKYKEVFQIDPKWLVKVAAYRGKWIDQSQSFNIYYAGNSGPEVSEIYQYAWRMGLKTTYYLRTLAVSQVEKSTVNTSDFGQTHTRSSINNGSSQDNDEEKSSTIQTEEALVNIVSGVDSSSSNDFFGGVGLDLDDNIKLCRLDDPDCEACQ